MTKRWKLAPLMGVCALALAGALPCGPGVRSPSQWLIGADSSNLNLLAYRISSDGSLTVTGSPVSVAGAYVLATAPNGLWGVVAGGTQAQPFRIDGVTGVITPGTAVTLPGANVTSVAVHPTGSFVYVADGTASPAGRVYAYTANATTGALSLVGSVTTGGLDYPHGLAVTPNGSYLYAANYASGLGTGDKVSGFSVNSGTGALTALGGSPFTATGMADPRNLTITPSGSSLYVVDESGNPTGVVRMTIGGAGALTAPTAVAAASGTAGGGIAVEPGARFAFSTQRSNDTVQVYSIASGTELLTAASATGSGGAFPVGFAAHPTLAYLYVANSGTNTISAFSFSTTTGTLTALSPATVTFAGSGATVSAVAIAKPSGS